MYEYIKIHYNYNKFVPNVAPLCERQSPLSALPELSGNEIISNEMKALPMNLWYRNLKARPSNPLSDKYLDAIIYGCENTKSKRENERAEYPIDATAILFNAVIFSKA